LVAVAGEINIAMLNVQIRKQFRSNGAQPFVLDAAASFAAGFTVLFGPSGAGKSTLLDCIAGLQQPDSGEIRLDEKVYFDAIRNLSLLPQSRELAYVFQSLALFPHLSVEENIRYGLDKLPVSEQTERTNTIAKSFRIENLLSRSPAEVSGGEKQRVALARALVTRPRVLLLDEPLTGLDSALRRSILEDLRAWNDANRIPILYVTHNREEVDAIGERVVTLVNGRVQKTGAPRAVLDAPRSVELAHAAGFENVLPAVVVEHRPADGVMRISLDHAACEIEIPLGGAAPGTEVRVAIRAGDILVATEPPHFLSARNILPGTIESLEIRGTMAALRVKAGANFQVHVTPGAVRALDLSPGLLVWLVIKTHSCHLVR
jgi:molybdate transport system ATP-binding protein